MMRNPSSPERRAATLAWVERAFEVPMLLLAIILLILVAIPEVTAVSDATASLLDAVGWMIWSVFALELGVKTYLAPNRWRYLLTHWQDVLMVVVPFLRPLRIIRIVIVASRFWRQLRLVLRRRTFSLVGTTSLVAVIAAATLMYAAERRANGPIQAYPDALWWAMSTITTVGYGDVYPVTPAGRGIAIFLMLAGISLFGLLTARVAAFFVEEEEQESQTPKLEEILRRLEGIEAELRELRKTRR